MHVPNELPIPDADALAHSERLSELIRQRIAAAGGWITFAQYMELALYAPGLGYYSAGATKFGAAGDFITAPEVSGLFAAGIARAIRPVVERSTDAGILEFGAGTGALAAGVLRTLARDGAPPARYRILEVSADLRERQRQTLREQVPDLLSRVEWLDELPAPFDGVVLANEVADALACSRVRIEAGQERLHELGVAAPDGGFCWETRAADESLRANVERIERSLNAALPAPYTADLSQTLPAFIHSVGDVLRTGVCLVIDYGLPRRELYAPDRCDGTLICHYRHRAHSNPFLYPGLQDISAWVDFTAAAEAAADAGLRVDGYMTQAHFLIAAGIEHEFSTASTADASAQARYTLSREMQTLLMPGEMGEKFKVMWFGKGPAALANEFLSDDQRHRL